ncbi:MAG: pantoate--beta-alanine ligase [Acidimicrobiia bacterium]
MHTVAEMREASRVARADGHRIGFVPTMGALHAGHAALIDRARTECGMVVVSVFVNPTQFDRADDLAAYPRTLDIDAAVCATHGTDVVFAPSANEMYPDGPRASLRAGDLGVQLEGASRPGHFDGVATIVARLLDAVEPDVAYFGRKDYQQTLVVRHMIASEGIPTVVEVLPTVRDHDGLALSSRNIRLSPGDRERALAIPRGLISASRLFDNGVIETDAIVRAVREELSRADIGIDYVVIVDPDSLAPLATARVGAVVLVAATVAGVRLIDNVILGR